MYIRRYTSRNEKSPFYSVTSNILLKKRYAPTSIGCQLHKITCQPMKSDVTQCRPVWIYCRKFMTLSHWTSRYICKCIRISFCFCNLRYNQVIYRTNHFTESNLNQHMTFQYYFKRQIATAQTSLCICPVSSLAHLSEVKWPIISLDSCA